MNARRTGTFAAPVALLLALPATGQQDASTTAAYQFAVAKMLAMEGAFQDAIAALNAAIRLRPEDPYLRLEQAELLVRLAERSGDAAARAARLAEAADAVRAAERLAPDNTDQLRLKSRIWLGLAERDPEAVEGALTALEALRVHQPGDVQSMLALGRLYLSRGRAASAAEVFREVVHNRPDARIAYTLLADALRRDRRPAEAEEVLRGLVLRDPAALDSRLELADLLSQRGEHRAAVELLRAAPPETRAMPAVEGRLAFELYRLGDLAGALAAVEPVVAANPEDVGGRYLRALILAAEARTDEAAAELEALHAASPASAEIALALARVRERQGRPAEGARALRATMVRLEDDRRPREAAALRLELGSALMREKRWAEAEAELAPLLDSADPDVLTDAAIATATSLQEQRRGPEALELLAARLAADPAARAKRAEILHREGRDAEARALLDDLARGGTGGRVLAADVYQRLEAYADSIALLEEVLAAEPQSAEARFRLGAAYERTGRRGEAIAAFRELLRQRADFAPALNYLGYMLAERGESLEEAVRLTQRAVDLDPDNGAYVDSLGWAHFQRGQLAEARRFLERAAGLEPADATVHEHLGDVYAALGDVERALSIYRRALELGPDDAAHLEKKLRDLRGGS